MATWRIFTAGDWQNADCDKLPAMTSPEYRIQLRRLKHHFESGSSRFEHGTTVGPKSKSPRTHVPRQYRLTSRGVILALVSMKHSEAYNLCEVDAFVTSPGAPDPGRIVREAALFLLSDAVKSGGSLAVQFRREEFGGGVPDTLRMEAQKSGVELSRAAAGLITPNEARALYLEWTPLCAAAKERAGQMHRQKSCSVERLCYLVHRGVWHVQEAEDTLLNCAFPDVVLGGFPVEEESAFFSLAQFAARQAVLAGFLRTKMQMRRCDAGEQAVRFPEDMPRPLVSVPQPAVAGRLFQPGEDVDLAAWSAGWSPVYIRGGQRLLALSRPYSAGLLGAKLAQEIRELAPLGWPDAECRAVVVPRDWFLLEETSRRTVAGSLETGGFTLLVCPVWMAGLDQLIRRRRMLAQSVRQ